MDTADFKYKLTGKYVHVEKCDFPLIDLNEYFTTDDLTFIFGENFDKDNYLIGIEKSKWYTHLIFRLNSSFRIVGYLELIKVRDEVELHGGGTNNSFIEKLARTEAWYLIIKYCFDEFKINRIFTTCRIDNVKAYNLITGTGFKETGKNEKGDCFKFKLSHDDFLSNRIFRMLSLNTKITHL